MHLNLINVNRFNLQGMCNDIDKTKLDNDERSDVNKKITTDEVLVNDNNKTTKSIESSDESDDEEDVRELEGRTVSAKGHEVNKILIYNNKDSIK